MDYKKIVKSQQLRFSILKLLSWVPDRAMLQLQYRLKMGFWPDLKHPLRFTEKLQLYKMDYRNPVMHQCVDKYEVRKYIYNKGLGLILNDLYGVYEKPDEIDFSILPEAFVMKTTTGGGGQNVIIVKNKSLVDKSELIYKLALWENNNNLGALAGREWAYEDCKPRIVIEKYLDDNNEVVCGSFAHEESTYNGSQGLKDYKFFCFDGKPYCVQVDSGRYGNHYQNYYDMQWNSLGVHCSYPEGIVVEKPLRFNVMKDIACELSKDFPFVRVDLYNISGRIYFGELTFYPSSGYGKFYPDRFDFELGRMFSEY